MDIPKGHIEDGETPLDAAKRELKEETGLVIPDNVEIFEIGRRKYQSKKSLHLFSVEMDFDFDKLHCDATFEDSFGNIKPENDWFVLTNCPDDFFKNMAKHVKEEMERRTRRPDHTASPAVPVPSESLGRHRNRCPLPSASRLSAVPPRQIP